MKVLVLHINLLKYLYSDILDNPEFKPPLKARK